MRQLSDRERFARLMDKIFEVKPRKRLTAADWHPARKNDNERSEPDLSDTDAGMPPDRDDDENETERLSREADNEKDKDNMTTKSHSLSDVVKRYGWQAVCKQLVENGTGSFSEAEVTEMLTVAAQKAYPGERPDVAFAKLYCGPDGELARRTTLAARDAGFISRTKTEKAATLQPRVVGGADARAVNQPKAALAALQELVDEQRRQHPTLTEAGAWDKVYTDPANREIVNRERAENRPTAGW
jgi:hypothetical protein